jgi:hypothetical protein
MARGFDVVIIRSCLPADLPFNCVTVKGLVLKTADHAVAIMSSQETLFYI